MNTASVHRKETFDEIIKYIRVNPDISNIVIGGDYNEHIGDNNAKVFHEKLGANNIYQIIDNIQINKINKTCVHGLSIVDSLATSTGIIEYIDGCKILRHNEIAKLDHMSYLVDILLEEYFQDELCK